MHEFSRTEMVLGKESLDKLKTSLVAVFGIGGVGSFVVEALARSGVGNLVLVDKDAISITNLNRQIHSTHSTLGKSKVEVMEERVRDINPRAKVVGHHFFYAKGDRENLVRADYDYIVDAVDNVSAKIDLVLRAKEMGIPIISCMGTGNKLEPTKLRVGDLFTTRTCPLARVMRRELRKRGIDNLKVVYSEEDPLKPKYDKEGMARRDIVPGSVAFVPSVAGLIIASEVVKFLIGGKKYE